MRKLSTALFTLALLACASGLQTVQPAVAEDNSAVGEIFVTGEASLKVEPDTVIITGRLFERAQDRDRVLTSISKINADIKKNLPLIEGLEFSDYASDRLSIEIVRPNGCQRVNLGNNDAPEDCAPIAYVGTLSFSAQVRPATIGGDVASYLTELGVEGASITGFSLSERSEQQDRVNELAVANAIEKAQMLAEAANARTGRILELSDGSSPLRFVQAPPVYEGLLSEGDFYSSSPIVPAYPISIAPPKETHTAKVGLRVELIYD